MSEENNEPIPPEYSELPLICIDCDKRMPWAECPHCAGNVFARHPYAQATVVSMQERIQRIVSTLRGDSPAKLDSEQEAWLHPFIQELEDMLPVIEP